MKVHKRTDEPLQKSIVDIARDTCSLAETFVSKNGGLCQQEIRARVIHECDEEKENHRQDTSDGPPLPNAWLNDDSDYAFLRIPGIRLIGGDQPERVIAGRQIGIRRLPLIGNIDPRFVEVIEAIAKTDA